MLGIVALTISGCAGYTRMPSYVPVLVAAAAAVVGGFFGWDRWVMEYGIRPARFRAIWSVVEGVVLALIAYGIGRNLRIGMAPLGPDDAPPLTRRRMGGCIRTHLWRYGCDDACQVPRDCPIQEA